MPIATRTFRVFVSSTFEDLKAERNALQQRVFPEMMKFCIEKSARFQAIDLRWGVREESGLDQKTMEICLSEIARCQKTGIKPNFIILLGDRYGWRPLPARIEQMEFEAVRAHVTANDLALVDRWYPHLDLNADPAEYLLQRREGEFEDRATWEPVETRLGHALRRAARAAGLSGETLVKYEASATHQEILAGLKRPEDRKHVFAFVRESSGPKEPELAGLIRQLENDLPIGNLFGFGEEDLDGLCTRVSECLTGIIESEVKGFGARTPLQQEQMAQQAFAEERARRFVGRVAVLGEIATYLADDGDRPLVIHGPSGSGKTAILARASQIHDPGDGRVIRRFIGATPEASDGRTLLRSLCEEIGKRYGLAEALPATCTELVVLFQSRLRLATVEKPLLLYIDALDQLSPQDPAAEMNWLPRELPPHSRIVVSTINLPDALANSKAVCVGTFSVQEAGETLSLWFKDVRRTLQKDQLDRLLGTFRRIDLPLYLKLAFEEARLWRSFDHINNCLLGDGLPGIIDQLFARLAKPENHGDVLVSHALRFLRAARYGLADDEILAVLAANNTVWQDFERTKRHDLPSGMLSEAGKENHQLPAIVWSRLYHDLEPYLSERTVPGGTTVTFYHRHVAERVETDKAHHRELAQYFAKEPTWHEPRGLSVLVFHITKADEPHLARWAAYSDFLEKRAAYFGDDESLVDLFHLTEFFAGRGKTDEDALFYCAHRYSELLEKARHSHLFESILREGDTDIFTQLLSLEKDPQVRAYLSIAAVILLENAGRGDTSTNLRSAFTFAKEAIQADFIRHRSSTSLLDLLARALLSDGPPNETRTSVQSPLPAAISMSDNAPLKWIPFRHVLWAQIRSNGKGAELVGVMALLVFLLFRIVPFLQHRLPDLLNIPWAIALVLTALPAGLVRLGQYCIPMNRVALQRSLVAVTSRAADLTPNDRHETLVALLRFECLLPDSQTFCDWRQSLAALVASDVCSGDARERCASLLVQTSRNSRAFRTSLAKAMEPRASRYLEDAFAIAAARWWPEAECTELFQLYFETFREKCTPNALCQLNCVPGNLFEEEAFYNSMASAIPKVVLARLMFQCWKSVCKRRTFRENGVLSKAYDVIGGCLSSPIHPAERLLPFVLFPGEVAFTFLFGIGGLFLMIPVTCLFLAILACFIMRREHSGLSELAVESRSLPASVIRGRLSSGVCQPRFGYSEHVLEVRRARVVVAAQRILRNEPFTDLWLRSMSEKSLSRILDTLARRGLLMSRNDLVLRFMSEPVLLKVLERSLSRFKNRNSFLRTADLAADTLEIQRVLPLVSAWLDALTVSLLSFLCLTGCLSVAYACATSPGIPAFSVFIWSCGLAIVFALMRQIPKFGTNPSELFLMYQRCLPILLIPLINYLFCWQVVRFKLGEIGPRRLQVAVALLVGFIANLVTPEFVVSWRGAALLYPSHLDLLRRRAITVAGSAGIVAILGICFSSVL